MTDKTDTRGWRWCTMPFGQYQGHTLRWIAVHDPDYLRWVKGIARQPLRKLVAAALEDVADMEEYDEDGQDYPGNPADYGSN